MLVIRAADRSGGRVATLRLRPVVIGHGPDTRPPDDHQRTDTLLLRPSRAKNPLLLALSAAFTSGGATMIRDSQSMGWIVMVFFGLFTLIALILLLPNSSYRSRSPARPCSTA